MLREDMFMPASVLVIHSIKLLLASPSTLMIITHNGGLQRALFSDKIE